MPFQSNNRLHLSTEEAVERLFGGPDTAPDRLHTTVQELEVAGYSGRVVIGALTIPPGKSFERTDLPREIVVAGMWEQPRRLAVAHMETKADGGRITRMYRRSLRIGAADYDAASRQWQEDYSAYNDSVLWARSSLRDMTDGLNSLLSPAARDPLRDAQAHAYLRNVLESPLLPAYSFVEPLFIEAAHLAIAATPPVG